MIGLRSLFHGRTREEREREFPISVSSFLSLPPAELPITAVELTRTMLRGEGERRKSSLSLSLFQSLPDIGKRGRGTGEEEGSGKGLKDELEE